MAVKAEPAPTDLSTILVAVDFSETSSRAFERACGLAEARGATLLIVHVLPATPLAIHGVQPMLPPPDLIGRIRALAEQELQSLVARAADRGLQAESVVAVGTPGRELADVATERGVDLIAIGTRGLTGFSHMVLGSTAEYVVRHAPCPVLTIHPDDEGSLETARSVLVPVELHGDPTRVGREVVRLLSPEQGAVRALLLYSDHLPAYLQPWMGELGIDRVGLEEIRGRLEQDLAPAAERLGALGFEVEVVISEGEPATVLTEVAHSRGVDLIAMQTHGRTGAAHWLLGSTAERVVQHAACPVLTVREPDDDEGAGASS
jgi:nucleotide-binding universal stress UspA family protein